MDVDIKDEAKGIRAIRALQKFAGIDESEEQARKGWRSMSDGERKQTLLAYEVVCGGDEGREVAEA